MSAIAFHDPTLGQLRESARLWKSMIERIDGADSRQALAALVLEVEALPRGLRKPLVERISRRVKEVR